MRRNELRELRSLMGDTVKIGTRGSKLALWQAEWVKAALEKESPDISVELVVIKTKGDKIQDVPLAKVGGKGLFVKEIEEAILEGRVDLAVHSMKDMPAEIPEGLCIGAIPEREDPRDVLISGSGRGLEGLDRGARVGTSSLRRAAQLRHGRPDLDVRPLRGNLDTRMRKLDEGRFDAVVLAAAGVKRLGLARRITQYLSPETVLPAVGQGALCIEIRENDPHIGPLAGALDHLPTRAVVTGERAFLHKLEGGCQAPIAAHGVIGGDEFTLTGLVAEPDGSLMIRETLTGPAADAGEMGVRLARRLLDRGAGAIVERLKAEADENG
jgi:hydroxymethylbilane synthase